jgi:hypothetical protein
MSRDKFIGFHWLPWLHVTVLGLLLCMLSGCDDWGTKPGDVSDLSAVASDASVTLTWTDPADADLDHIAITWTPDDPDEPMTVEAGVEEALITGLTNEEEHTFTVTAIDEDGNESDGVAIIATPHAAPDNASVSVFYVATDGNDSNPGSAAQPWQTIQKAGDAAPAGSTICVRGGVYQEQVQINVSGSAAAGPITFRNAEGETPVLDGTGLSVPEQPSGIFLIADQSYITIQGFEIRNYRTAVPGAVPVGIHVTGSSHHIQIRNNRIHAIETNAPVDADLLGADAHGIAVYGTKAPASINNIEIEGNELYDLKLGSSETLVVNGNVENFTVSGNTIHDVDNIGIDIIGFEGTAPDGAYDQARQGLISGNTVYNVSSYGNPAYGDEYCAGGIYVDGGADTVIEQNIVYAADIGIELASEHQGRSTSRITVRNNFVYENRVTGISLGGYDELRGSTQECVIVNNTLYNNDTLQDGSGEIGLAFDTRNNIITNNILYANEQSLLIENSFATNSGNLVDYNLYYAPAGSQESEWRWKNQTYQGFDAYQQATGNDAHSLFTDPRFVSLVQPDLHLQPGSPAVDAGDTLSEAGTQDIDGGSRVQGSGIDIGADERP